MKQKRLPPEPTLAALYRALDEGVITVDLEGVVTGMNRAAEALTGYSLSEAGGKPFLETAVLLDPRSREPLKKLFRESDGQPSRRLRCILVPKTRSENKVSVSTSAITADGAVAGYVATIRDESRQSVAEDALRNSETLYRMIVENSFDAIYLLRGKRYEYVNPRFCEITGYSFAELTSPSFDYNSLLPEESRRFMQERFSARESGRPIPPEYRIQVLTRNGKTVEVEVTTHQLESKNSVRVLGIMRDISTRIHAEEGLQKSESLMKSVFSSMVDSVFLFDEDMRFIFVNVPEMELLMPPSAFLGRRFGDVMPDVMTRQFEAAFEETKTGRASEYEYTLDLPSGTGIYSTKLSPVTVGGRFSGAVGVIRDITDRRRLESEQTRLQDQLRQTQKLESLGLLAGGIAHDFNNLLMGILGNAELASVEIGGASGAVSHIRSIETAARKAADLCRQMLAYAGRGRTTNEAVEINSLIREMAELLRVGIPEGVTLKFDLAPDLLPVDGDPSQLSQVVMNLITNAAEAIQDGQGTITLITRSMYCDREYLRGSYINDDLPPGIYVYIEVCDTGCGMDEETRTRIFDPFYSTKFTGRGLGLAAVLGIVRGHHGAIRVYSEPGEGTTFKIIMPPSPSAMVRDREEKEDMAGQQGRVLLIDDEDIVRNVVTRMLSKLGYGCDAAPDGAAGLEMLTSRRNRYLCVILDMAMPGMDGAKVLRSMREISPMTKVVVMSGYDEREVVERLGQLTPDGVLQKPFRIETLQEALEKALKSD